VTVRITVIIPCFNDGETLPAALASVSAQEACELVVVDDGSDDPGTIARLRELEKTGLRVIRQPNQGPSAARLTALAATGARYVFALDADDVILPGALTALADALDANPSAAVAWGDIETFGVASVFQRGPRALDAWLMTYLNDLTGASTLIRRSRLAESGWRPDVGFEHWDLWLTFCERGWQGIYVPGLVLRYRQHTPGTRRSGQARGQFSSLYAELQLLHPRLFRERRALWRRSAAPRRLKVGLPIIDRLPLNAYTRHRLGNILSHPLRPIHVRWSRLRHHADR
jgi:glycosyltransferase involved in cell wall biosynthesis